MMTTRDEIEAAMAVLRAGPRGTAPVLGMVGTVLRRPACRTAGMVQIRIGRLGSTGGARRLLPGTWTREQAREIITACITAGLARKGGTQPKPKALNVRAALDATMTGGAS